MRTVTIRNWCIVTTINWKSCEICRISYRMKKPCGSSRKRAKNVSWTNGDNIRMRCKNRYEPNRRISNSSANNCTGKWRNCPVKGYCCRPMLPYQVHWCNNISSSSRLHASAAMKLVRQLLQWQTSCIIRTVPLPLTSEKINGDRQAVSIYSGRALTVY